MAEEQISNEEVLKIIEGWNDKNLEDALKQAIDSIRDVRVLIDEKQEESLFTELILHPVPDDIPAKTIEELEKTIKTGDILLFSGEHITSKLIRICTNSPYSHVAVLIRDKDRLLYVWESIGATGPRKVPFDQAFLDGYEGSVVFREVQWTNNVDEAAAQKFAEEVSKKGFPYKIAEDLVRGIFKKKPTGKGYFCSELVAETLQVMNLLPKDVPINTIYPEHFNGKRLEKKGLVFNNYYLLKKPK